MAQVKPKRNPILSYLLLPGALYTPTRKYSRQYYNLPNYSRLFILLNKIWRWLNRQWCEPIIEAKG